MLTGLKPRIWPSGACSLEDLLSNLEVVRIDDLREVTLLGTDRPKSVKQVREDQQNVLHGASHERSDRRLAGRVHFTQAGK